MKSIFTYIVGVLGLITIFGGIVLGADDCSDGIKLNTDVPFVGNCIGKGDQTSGNETNIGNAFPKLMGGLSKIVITFLLITSLVVVILGGVLITAGGASTNNIQEGKKLIMKVVVAIALLGLSGMILHIINPNFFKI